MPQLPPDRLSDPLAGQQHSDPVEETVDSILQQAVLDIAAERSATSFHDPTPAPRIGTAPPVQQPGRPAMSQRATDASVMMIASGFLSLCVGGAGSALLYFSGIANPIVVGLLTAAPPVAFLSIRARASTLILIPVTIVLPISNTSKSVNKTH